jgi:hypothetical protein
MSYYTNKMVNCIETTGCKHYKRKNIVEEWDNRWAVCNNKDCKTKNQKRFVKGHVHVGRSKKIYISPLCDSCNSSKNNSWMTISNDNKFVLVASCDCCNCERCSKEKEEKKVEKNENSSLNNEINEKSSLNNLEINTSLNNEINEKSSLIKNDFNYSSEMYKDMVPSAQIGTAFVAASILTGVYLKDNIETDTTGAKIGVGIGCSMGLCYITMILFNIILIILFIIGGVISGIITLGAATPWYVVGALIGMVVSIIISIIVCLFLTCCCSKLFKKLDECCCSK